MPLQEAEAKLIWHFFNAKSVMEKHKKYEVM